MKLGIIGGWDDESFSYAKKKGLSFVEFCVNCNYNVPEFITHTDEVKGYIKKYGVGVGSVGRWGSDRLNADGSVNADEMKNSKLLIDFCAEVGCKVFVMGCNAPSGRTFKENIDSAVEMFLEVVAYGEEKGVKIAIYNCDWNNFIYEEKTWDIVLPAVPGLGIKYDTSHAIGRRSDWMKQMRDYGDKIYHVHIKGSHYIGGDHYDDPPAGLDETNWGAFFNLLYTKHYDGTLSLEPHSGAWQGKMGRWGVDFSIDYIRPYIMPEDYEGEGTPYMP